MCGCSTSEAPSTTVWFKYHIWYNQIRKYQSSGSNCIPHWSCIIQSTHKTQDDFTPATAAIQCISVIPHSTIFLLFSQLIWFNNSPLNWCFGWSVRNDVGNARGTLRCKQSARMLMFVFVKRALACESTCVCVVRLMMMEHWNNAITYIYDGPTIALLALYASFMWHYVRRCIQLPLSLLASFIIIC